MSQDHVLIRCGTCGVVMGQCRCMGPKREELSTCNECRRKETK